MTRKGIVVELIEALAEADGLKPTELKYSLYDHMDPEVVKKLDSMKGGIWEIKFRVSDHQVRISHEGQIFINGMEYVTDVPEHE